MKGAWLNAHSAPVVYFPLLAFSGAYGVIVRDNRVFTNMHGKYPSYSLFLCAVQVQGRQGTLAQQRQKATEWPLPGDSHTQLASPRSSVRYSWIQRPSTSRPRQRSNRTCVLDAT